jgi:hypothetical protein
MVRRWRRMHRLQELQLVHKFCPSCLRTNFLWCWLAD